MAERIAVIPGDGIGQEVVPAARRVLESVADFEFVEAEAGDTTKAETVRYADTTIEVTVDDAQRRALVDGVWDTTALMKANLESTREKAASLPYVD